MSEQKVDIWSESKPKRGGRRKRREDGGSGTMNINSLMDIMVIILVFLLKSYGDEPLKVEGEDIKAPSSMAELSPKDMTTISITQKAILVDDKKAVDVKAGAVDKSQKKDGDKGLMITPLFEKLQDAVKRKKREKELMRQTYEPVVTIITDQAIPYRLVTEVMYTAGQAELSQFKIAVIKKARNSFGTQK